MNQQTTPYDTLTLQLCTYNWTKYICKKADCFHEISNIQAYNFSYRISTASKPEVPTRNFFK